jgi:hypothetical protein
VTTTLDYTTALGAAHDDAAASLERSREQLEELLRTLDEQRAEISDELERVQRALVTLTPTAPAAAPPAAPPERPQARRRARAKRAAQTRPPQAGTNAYRVAEVFANWARRTPRPLRSAPAWTAGRCIASSSGSWSSGGSSRAPGRAAPSRTTGAVRRWARHRFPPSSLASSCVGPANHAVERLLRPARRPPEARGLPLEFGLSGAGATTPGEPRSDGPPARRR